MRGARPEVATAVAALILLSVAAAAPVAGVASDTSASPAATPTPPGPADDLERGVPRTAVLEYLRACREGDYERAAEYLDLRRINPKDRPTQGPILALHLKVVIDHTMWVNPDTLSDEPEGDTADGLPARRDRLGTIRTAKDGLDILLERVPREDGVPIWKFSAQTVALIPALYAQFGYGPFGDVLPTPLFEITFLDVELWQWIGLALLALIGAVVPWALATLIARLFRPIAARLHRTRENKLEQLVVGPVRLALGIIIFYAGSVLLKLSLPVRAFFNSSAEALVVAALTWLVLRLIDIVTRRMEDRLVARGQATAMAMLPLGRRTAKAFLIAVAALALLQNLGFNVSGLVAGLGVGGLAVALAAQETIKNFFGGVALITDQPVRVGDFCRFGDKTGIVEDISIWSTRVRTLERTIVSIPNGQFAGMQLENFSRRDRIWLHATLGLQYDSTPDQIRRVLEEIQKMLEAHPKVHGDSARVRFVGFGGPSLQIEISAYILTARLGEFLATREDIFLQTMDVIGRSGTKLAPQ